MTSENPLRILIVVNLPWDIRLGAIRVWVELAEQWRERGHSVEHYSLTEAFGDNRGSGPSFAIRQITFARKAARFVRNNRERFDVIDALIGALPFSKKSLGFKGLLVARSVGLYLLYDEFQRTTADRSSEAKGTLRGRVLYGVIRRLGRRASDHAVRYADLFNVPNETEAACLRATESTAREILVQPYGLTDEQRRAFLAAASPPHQRLTKKKVCFVGMWSVRKGAADWQEIISRIRARVPETEFGFLGTMVEPRVIRDELGEAATGVELVSKYEPEQLPSLLADCAVGAFPSYIEGFGLAVTEQLAAGIPTVAYDTAGPRDILIAKLPELLVPPGDIEAFAAAICLILQSTTEAYTELSQRSAAAAASFSWRTIADATIEAYREQLTSRKFGAE